MNMGQAVAVCLYELIREHGIAVSVKQPPTATIQELDLMTNLFAEALYDSEYMTIDGRPSTEQKLRRLFRRLSISASDATLLLGMVRQLTNKR